MAITTDCAKHSCEDGRPMPLAQRMITVIKTTMATQLALTSIVALANETSSEPPDLMPSLVGYETQPGRETARDLDGTPSAAPPEPTLAPIGKEKTQRRRAVEMLGSLKQSTHNTVPDLISALRSDEPQSRRHAARALGRLGGVARHAMPALLTAIGDSRWGVRADAAWAIGKVVSEEHDVDAVNALVIALDDPSDHVRWSAAWSLARIGPTAESAVPALLDRLKDPEGKIRASAAVALTKVASESDHDLVIPALSNMLDDKDRLARTRAATALRILKAVSDAR
ncbi:MAG: HEAT repeat domain-containing protein [Geminicoccaceae bacterium]